jgi:hypothetical protein
VLVAVILLPDELSELSPELVRSLTLGLGVRTKPLAPRANGYTAG